MNGGPSTEPDAARASRGVPERIAGYRVHSIFARARMGNLVIAEDEGGMRVLVRVLADSIAASPALLERIEADLARLETLSHPNLSQVLGRGEEEGQRYYVLEDRGGLPLLEVVRRSRPLDERELAWVGRGLAAGLAALHGIGLAHGELSPASILVSGEGPVILDLGWFTRLRALEGDTPPPALPPPDLAADVAALGATLVFATTGAPPRRRPGEESVLAQAPWLPTSLAGLIDSLCAPAEERPDAAQVAARFAAEAAALGVGEAPPASVLDLIEGYDPGNAPTSPEAPPGEEPPLGRFGRYVLVEEIARGGMGIVYRARHADFERTFALKVMLAGSLADEDARARFLREAEAAAALDHPGIVRVHDCGEVEGRAYIAMDLAEGRPLTDLWHDPEVELERLLRIVVEVLHAVHYAHSRGIVHRDIKPENVLVDGDGQPHILDFGVAKRLGEGPGELTLAGELVGTPAYMPPEQAEGRSNDIDTRSDVYAVGATLFQLATRGRLPFEGKNVTDTLTRILLEEPPAPSALLPGLPWEVDAIVLRALEKERERRYQSAAEMAEDIERFLQGLPIRARQASWGYRARKWVRRRWRGLAAAGAAAVVVLGVSAWFVVREGERRAQATAERAQSIAGFLRSGDAALAAGNPTLAKDQYLKVVALDPQNLPAIEGRLRAEQALVQRRQEVEQLLQRDRELEQARRLVEDGNALLERGDPAGARRAFEQALAFPVAPAEARAGLLRAERALADATDAERERLQEERDAAQAARYVDEARGHLEAGRLREAQAALLKALAFGSERAEALLLECEEALVRERAALVQEELRRRNRADAGQHLARARAHEERGELQPARTELIQALALDGGNDEVREALLAVDRRLRELEEEARDAEVEAARRDRAERLARELAQVDAAVERGRELYRAGEDINQLQEAYLSALEGCDRALFAAPERQDIRRRKERIARELALILREEGLPELSGFLIRLAGGTEDATAAVNLPEDPHLLVVEADKVGIRRAFGGGTVRFEPTRAFDRLRAEVQAAGGDRYRIVVQVRSDTVANGPQVQVMARGLWLQLEDRVAKTRSAQVQIAFEGGPYPRQVRQDAHGRIVRPWESGFRLDVPRYVAEAEKAARALLEQARRR